MELGAAEHVTYDHTGKTAVVTGATTGIGRAIGVALAKAGAFVVIDYLDDEQGAKSTIEEIEAAGGLAISVQADVSKPDAVKDLFKRAAAHSGAVDILVNNASVEVNKFIWEMEDDEWRYVIANSLDSIFYCSKYVLPYMMPNRQGKIVNISSIHDEVPRVRASPYCASKAGLMMMTKVLALELAPYSIQVNAVSPGVILTERTGHVLARTPEQRTLGQRVIHSNPFKRAGLVEEIVEPVLYLCSPHSGYTSGTTIYVDGAYRLAVSPTPEMGELPPLDHLKS